MLSVVAEVDGRVVGWLSAHVEPPDENAAMQFVRERDWTRLVVDALIVERQQWRRGTGTRLLESAESWGRAQGTQVVRLDTYAQSPVSVPFYERHMGRGWLAPLLSLLTSSSRVVSSPSTSSMLVTSSNCCVVPGGH